MNSGGVLLSFSVTLPKTLWRSAHLILTKNQRAKFKGRNQIFKIELNSQIHDSFTVSVFRLWDLGFWDQSFENQLQISRLCCFGQCSKSVRIRLIVSRKLCPYRAEAVIFGFIFLISKVWPDLRPDKLKGRISLFAKIRERLWLD